MRDVYDMTWREFSLKKAGWERDELRKWDRTRMIAYWSGVDGGFDGKKTSISKFMPLGSETTKPVVSESHKEAFKKAMDIYKQKVKEKNGE